MKEKYITLVLLLYSSYNVRIYIFHILSTLNKTIK